MLYFILGIIALVIAILLGWHAHAKRLEKLNKQGTYTSVNWIKYLTVGVLAALGLWGILAFSLGSSTPTAEHTQPTLVAKFTHQSDYLKVSFDASTSYDHNKGHEINGYTWQFGDGNGDTGVKPIHTYTAAGTYTVTLVVSEDNDGKASKPATEKITVKAKPAPSPTSTAPSKPAQPQACTTWKMSTKTLANHDWTPSIDAIKKAKTSAQARAAAVDWTNLVKTNTGTLQGASAYFLNKTPDLKSLADKQGCATHAAVALVNELGVQFALSEITPAVAPANGYNSGTENGAVLASASTGISGDRKAIEVTMPNGKKVWVMARCGNAVTVGKPPVKQKPTPKPTPPPTHTTPPKTCESVYGNGYTGTYPNCSKPKQSFNCQQNNVGCEHNNPYVQPPQHEGPGQHKAHKKTPGAGNNPPAKAPKGPAPKTSSPAPPPNSGGYDSGSGDGSGTPGGSTCDKSGCQGGGSQPGSGPTDTTHSGDNNGTDGDGNSTGDGGTTNPFG